MKSLGLMGPEQNPFYVKTTKLGAPLEKIVNSESIILTGIKKKTKPKPRVMDRTTVFLSIPCSLSSLLVLLE